MINNNQPLNEILNYCNLLSEKNSEITLEIEKYTYKNEKIPQMLCGHLIGNFLQLIIKITNAKNILEIGMFTGFSALKMAEAIPANGKVHTFELMEKHINTAKSFFSKSHHGYKINIHQGNALENLEQMPVGKFDLAFIDADKINYLEYYKRCFTLIKNNGIILLDNMLWSGNVLNPIDDDSKILNKTAEFINNDQRVFNLLLPIRDGLMVCIKNEK